MMTGIAQRHQKGRVDWLYGLGATARERTLVKATWMGALAVLAFAWVLDHGQVRSELSWWQLLVAGLLVIDVAGGVAANATDAAKRLYHGPLPADVGRLGRLVHGHVTFAALHVHPIAVGLLFPGAGWWWGPVWYLTVLAGVVLVRKVPADIERPTAVAIATVAIVISTLIPAPLGFAWFPAVLVLKLVVAHAVAEQPTPHPHGLSRTAAVPSG